MNDNYFMRVDFTCKSHDVFTKYLKFPDTSSKKIWKKMYNKKNVTHTEVIIFQISNLFLNVVNLVWISFDYVVPVGEYIEPHIKFLFCPEFNELLSSVVIG